MKRGKEEGGLITCGYQSPSSQIFSLICFYQIFSLHATPPQTFSLPSAPFFPNLPPSSASPFLPTLPIHSLSPAFPSLKPPREPDGQGILVEDAPGQDKVKAIIESFHGKVDKAWDLRGKLRGETDIFLARGKDLDGFL